MTSHDVTLEWPDGRTRTIAVREDETVLEAAERDDSTLPFGCRTGACGTRTGRLLEDGDDALTHRRQPRVLKDRHRAAGYVLLCLASPRADCRIAVGSSVHSELVDNPWK
ncbi:ferredoxin [Natrinema pellirubrum DSM 15624]|uniref:Ferredoxin n=1 Tax=Natrinema pellirubrum (strain DSM 15624 / CIP 106293 / JCM 10476 / NCIMB 786 / 157) TaxID=797303 RepID=L0JIE6_NATP1|nr:2Fe-2S iron-sulfur cluster-binding protein [Natrinema pellirubrum]AGB30116.1 ferredoxin [Natrinema pellirubrum DSM 15624]ELY69820.1 ferredoxin [Natrinema pellirubrum DSM 15624]